MSDTEKFITAYNSTTGEPQRVPERWFNTPALVKGLRKTPPNKAAKTPATGDTNKKES